MIVISLSCNSHPLYFTLLYDRGKGTVVVSDRAVLVLDDGSIWNGRACGVVGATSGPLVFNTAMTGYEEVITDPSYARQILLFTAPYIGTVGINLQDKQSDQVSLRGVICKNLSCYYNHPRAVGSLHNFLVSQKIVGITGVDTRALVHHIRDRPSTFCCIMTQDIDTQKASFIAQTISEPITDIAGTKTIRPLSLSGQYHVGIIDYGTKASIADHLIRLGCKVTLLPSDTPADAIDGLELDGIVLSNGPFDPQMYDVRVIAHLLKKQIPIFGICLGHQLLALASGASIIKMQTGHRGINHPVIHLPSKRVYVTCQNHGFVVDENTLPPSLTITYRSLVDHTIMGLRHNDCPAISFQGHPEGGGGPYDMLFMFDQFIQMMEVAVAKT